MKRVTREVRLRLKRPLGILIKGSPSETAPKIQKLIESLKPSKIIAVGDVVAESLFKLGIKPYVYLVDGKSLRSPLSGIELSFDTRIVVDNPQGTVTEEAEEAIAKAMKEDGITRIEVVGEEDLLGFPAVLLAPNNALVFYGQPKRGIVAVLVNEDKKRAISRIYEAMSSG